VSPNHLRAQIEIWDRLVQDLIAYLREELRKLGTTSAANAAAPQDASHARQPDRAAEPDAPVATIQ
jgi:hypothetical protein